MNAKSWITRFAIAGVMVASFVLGYKAKEADDYLDWRAQNIRAFQPAGVDGLRGTLIRELEAISAYKTRNDNSSEDYNKSNSSLEEKTKPESDIDKERRLGVYHI